MLPEFEPDFAGLADYARMYRALGLQAVPSYYPSKRIPNWKRPALKGWVDFQNELVDDATFKGWFNNLSESSHNIGILTGRCSGRVFVVDLDTHSNPNAALWWSCCMDMQEHAGELESPTQRTGGGGLQILFRAPDDWDPPTIKTSIGVDIRGIGGFIVAAPSMHESGRRYEWVDGQAPWDIEIADAPLWLCEQIDALAQEHGGHAPRDASVKTSTPDHQHDAWGALKDGREDYMFRMIWGRLVDIARDCPIMPNQSELNAQREDLFGVYLSKVDSRLPHASHDDKAALLEREGRGATEFAHKWRMALKDWDKVLRHAAAPKPAAHPAGKSFERAISEGISETVADYSDNKSQPENSSDDEEWDRPSEKISVAAAAPTHMFDVLDIEAIFNLPDPVFLFEGLMIEMAAAFVYGAPGCGKTFVALDMAFSLCCDEVTHWFGNKVNKHGPVVYISSEGSTDMKFRIMAWEKLTGIKINRDRFHFIHESMNFMDPADIVKLIQSIKFKVSNRLNEKPVMIVVDTISRVLPGADENLQKDMTLYIKACDAVRMAFNSAVLGVHHTSKGSPQEMRGSTTFLGAGNTVLYVEREKPAMEGVIVAKKVKEARDGWETAFQLKEVDLGFFRSSLVATSLTPAAGVAAPKTADFGGAQDTGAEPDMETCRRMVDAIQAAWDGKYAWSKVKGGRDNDRYVVDKLVHNFNLDPEVCKRYVDMWLKNDVIIEDSWGPDNKKRGLKRGKGL